MSPRGQGTQSQKWSRRVGLNHRPAVYENELSRNAT